MPKDRYVCAPMLGHGHREAAKVEFDSRRAVARLTTVFCGTSSGGGTGASRARSSRTLAWPSAAPSSTRGASGGARSLSTATTHEEIWMRPRRPYVTTLADVTINRSGESAVITYGGPAVHPVVFAIGPDIDRCSDAEILARFNDSLHAARAQTEGRQHVVVEIPRGHAQLDYFAPAGQWVPRAAVLRCLLDESPEGARHRHRRSRTLAPRVRWTLAHLHGLGHANRLRRGRQRRAPLVEIRDLENGEAAHEWR